MTGTAGFTILHLFHGRLIRAPFGLEQVGMAIVTAKHACVYGVGESDVTDAFVLEEDVAGMAFVAIASHAERPIPIMAAATRPTSLHRFHVDVVAVALLLKEFRVTFITSGAMFSMAEEDLADGLSLYVDFVYHPPLPARAAHAGHTRHVKCEQKRRQGKHQQNGYSY